ncbi:MAG: esterase-like activity of phytase family protein [Bacteroidaceae bacterium]|nr:esterase-like activity of phytase family protein [Bacteroidaceae bacterium]
MSAFFILITVCTSLFAGNNITLRKQKNLAKWNVVGANYSGIAHIGGDTYAVVDDKDAKHTFRLFSIDVDSEKGKVKRASIYKEVGESHGVSDAEGIAYVPSRNTLFVSDEANQRVVEYTTEGVPTGRKLAVPKAFGKDAIYGNYGFEALTYSEADHCLWTVTEHTLKADGVKAMPGDTAGCVLRLLAFDDQTLEPVRQYAYRLDAPRAKKKGRNYAYGVSALCALDDGSVLVMEREFHVAKRYLGSWVRHKIYRVVPSASQQIGDSLPPSAYMNKTLVAKINTHLDIVRHNLANYEGMCLGSRLADGSQVLILISDSQNNYGNSFYRMKDYVKILIIDN